MWGQEVWSRFRVRELPLCNKSRPGRYRESMTSFPMWRSRIWCARLVLVISPVSISSPRTLLHSYPGDNLLDNGQGWILEYLLTFLFISTTRTRLNIPYIKSYEKDKCKFCFHSWYLWKFYENTFLVDFFSKTGNAYDNAYSYILTKSSFVKWYHKVWVIIFLLLGPYDIILQRKSLVIYMYEYALS